MSLDSESLGSLFRVGGGWGNISGPGLFMTKCLLTGTVTAIAFGLTGATLPAMVFGTAALPFVVASCAGFVAGTVGFYSDGVTKAILAMERYPRLLRLHLDSNFPAQRFDLWDERRLRGREFRGSWQLSSMLLVGWLTATPALDRIKEQEEEAIITSHARKEA